MKHVSDRSWDDLKRERYRWAEESFFAFLQRVDAQRLIQSKDNAQRQISVILYGPSQVGKTSLILTLLGIRDDVFNRVNTILRGGQLLGQMSTARTLRYRAARDDFWYFSHCHNGEQRFTDEEATQQFAALRQEMEQGVRHIESIDVFLPQRFFDPDLQCSAQLLIRDLPGTQSKNSNEQYYVGLLASRYLASADVVLLTGKADSLSFLRPEALEDTSLANWHWQRHRYKVVLTRAYSDATLQGLITREQADIPALRHYLLGQINSLDLALPQSIGELIYPLECGTTWLAIMARDDAFAQRCRELRQHALDALFTSLLQASNPLSRLRTGYALPDLIQQQIAADEAHYAGSCALRDKQRRRLETHLTRYQTLIAFSEKQHHCREKKQQRLQDAQKRAGEAECVASAPELSTKTAKTVDGLKARLLAYSSSLAEQWAERLIDAQLPPRVAPARSHLNEVLTHLNTYWNDTYWRDKNYDNDRNAIERAFVADADRLTKRYRRDADEHFAGLRATLAGTLAKSSHKIARLRRRHHQLQENMANLMALMVQKEDEYKQHHAEQSRQYHESKNFLNVIIAAKNKRASDIVQKVKDPATGPQERLGWVLMHRMLSNDFAYVKSLNEGSPLIE